METSAFRKISLLFWIVSLFLIPSRAEVLSPLDAVKDSNRKILEIYSSYDEIDEEAENRIIEIMDSVTKFDLISRRTIEKFCADKSDPECETLDRVFKKLLRISSMKKLGRYRADRFDYLGEEKEGDKATVKTIAYYQDDEVKLDYHLESIDGIWMIVNYVADDVDAILNYRKQFTRILRKESVPQLVERLQRKIEEYERE